MRESQNDPQESITGLEESREETLEEFRRRMHCAHVSSDELLNALYDERQAREVTRMTLLVANNQLNAVGQRCRELEAKLNTDNQAMHIECLKEMLKIREKAILRLLNTCTKLLGEWLNMLPKRVRYRHHTELMDEAKEVIDYTTRLTATLVNTESNENAGLGEKRERS